MKKEVAPIPPKQAGVSSLMLQDRQNKSKSLESKIPKLKA